MASSTGSAGSGAGKGSSSPERAVRAWACGPSRALPVEACLPIAHRLVAVLLLIALFPATAPSAAAQEVDDPPPLFASAAPLRVTLRADVSALREDRRVSPDRPGVLVVERDDGTPVEIPVDVRTRGNFRLDPANCSFPPLRIDVDGDGAVGTVFQGQDDLKLVSSCRPERESWEELVVAEYLAYRSLGAVSDATFRVRRLRVAFEDSAGEEEPGERIGFLIEDEDALARRLGATEFELEEGKNLPATAFDPVSRMTNAVAQYMLGNPDWSDEAGHNVEILDRGGVALAVPYDFDFSGVVDAPYATPPPEYRLDSVRERYYRGWCENPVTTRTVLERFRAARDAVLEPWRTEPGLTDGSRRRALDYLEAFFDAIETEERAELRFLRDCRALRAGGQDPLRVVVRAATGAFARVLRAPRSGSRDRGRDRVRAAYWHLHDPAPWRHPPESMP